MKGRGVQVANPEKTENIQIYFLLMGTEKLNQRRVLVKRVEYEVIRGTWRWAMGAGLQVYRLYLQIRMKLLANVWGISTG